MPQYYIFYYIRGHVFYRLAFVPKQHYYCLTSLSKFQIFVFRYRCLFDKCSGHMRAIIAERLCHWRPEPFDFTTQISFLFLMFYGYHSHFIPGPFSTQPPMQFARPFIVVYLPEVLEVAFISILADCVILKTMIMLDI